MNAYELYEAAFDTACDYAESTIGYVKTYAEEVYNIFIDDSVAQKIVSARIALDVANNENGQWTNNYFHIVEKPLSEIEV